MTSKTTAAWVAGLCVVWPLLLHQPVYSQAALTPAEEKGLAAAEAAKRKLAEADARAAREEARRDRAEADRAKLELQTFKDREAAKAPEAAKAASDARAAATAKPAEPAATAEPAKARPAALAAPPASRFRPMEALLQVAGCEACGQMSVIEAGPFDMGYPRNSDEGPMRSVQVGRFEIGRTEVTQGQWKAVMGSNPSGFKNCGDACPVENVSWNDIAGADGFLARLKEKTGVTYRLPTEAEWEYAARAGSKTAFWWGDAINPTQANYDGNSVYVGGGQKGDYRAKTVKADAFEANAWGLYNVHGNVWEWVQDCWHDSYSGAPPTGEEWKGNCTEARRVVRGGAWDNSPGTLRSAFRGRGAPDNRSYDIGFRLARTF